MVSSSHIKRAWNVLGPGVLLAATSIGASHLVLSPQAGARFGYSLLWLVLASHLFKYPAFECGPRYAAATGKHLLHGYARLGGPRGWALWLFLSGTVLQGTGVLAGVVAVSAAVLRAWTGLAGMSLWSGLVVAFVLALLLRGGFDWLDALNKVMMATLALVTLLAFIPVCPGAKQVGRVFIPSLPDGSIVLVAAMLGWMPTGIDVSIWHSFWSLEKFKRFERKGMQEAVPGASRLRAALFDMRVGYLLSLLTGLMFVCMGAAHLAGLAEQLRGVAFADALSRAYTAVLGSWMRHLFMLCAFFAMFSTSYTVIDGFSRSFSEGLATLFEGAFTPSRKRGTYVGFAAATSLLAVATITLVGNPVTLVTAVATVSLAIAPLLYGLNLWCTSRHITDPHLRAHPALMVLGWLGVGGMLLVVGLTVYLKLAA